METISRLLLTFLLNAGWQIALITAVATVCAWLLRKTTARYRHLLWVSALFMSLIVPVLTCSQIIREAIFNRPSATTSVSPGTTVVANISPGIASSDRIVERPLALSSELPTRMEAGNRPIQISRNIALAIVSLYLLFILYRGIRLIRAWRRTAAIKKSAYSLEILDSAGTHERITTVVDRCKRLINVSRVRILWSRSVPMPITVGSIDPLVILPEQLLLESDSNILTSAVGHELVHILRRDYLFNLLYEVIYVLLSFHPAMTLVRRQVNQTRELGCDEMVTQRLLSPQAYARSLVQLAGSTLPTVPSMTTMTVGINDADILEQRLKTMLSKPSVNVRRKSILFGLALLCLVVPCVAAVPMALRVGINVPHQNPKPQAQEIASPRPAEPAAIGGERAQLTVHPGSIAQQSQTRNSSDNLAARREEAMRENRQTEIEAAKRRADEEERERERKRELESQQTKADVIKQDREREFRGNLEFDSPMTEAQKKELAAANRSEQQSRVKRQMELIKQAKINMQQAVRIATNQQTGTVTECSLGREKDTIFYRVLIVSGDRELSSTRVLVNAVDGQVISVNRE